MVRYLYNLQNDPLISLILTWHHTQLPRCYRLQYWIWIRPAFLKESFQLLCRGVNESIACVNHESQMFWCVWLIAFYWLYFLKSIKTFLKETFRLIAKLKRRNRYFSLPLPPHMHGLAPTTSIPHQDVHVSLGVHLRWQTRRCHLESIVNITVHSWCRAFSGFEQMCNDMCPSLWYHTEYCLCSLCLFIPSPRPHPSHAWWPLIFFSLHSFSFSRIPCSRNHAVI